MGLLSWIRRPESGEANKRGKLSLSSSVRTVRPKSRPAWNGQLLPQNGILYPDDNLLSLMEECRRTFPLFDRGIAMLAELVGVPEIEGSKGMQRDLSHWMEHVKVNQHQQGVGQWLLGHLDGMLLYGKGVGEVVPSRSRTELAALVNIDPRSVLFQTTDDPLTLRPMQRQRHKFELLPLDPARTVISLYGGYADRPHGTSVFRSCGFVARALRTIENATTQNWQRLGSPPFHINTELDEEMQDPQGTLAAEVLTDLKTAWDAVMGTAREVDTAQVADYFTAGKVTVSVMGADGHVLEISEPYRVFAEQVVTAISLPAWMFGFHWSAAERLAGQQLQLAIARIQRLRKTVEPELVRVLETRQRLAGRTDRWKLCWPSITLADLESAAKSAMMQEQAERQKVERIRLLWELGYIDQQTASTLTDATLGPVVRPMTEPPPLTGTMNPDIPPGKTPGAGNGGPAG